MTRAPRRAAVLGSPIAHSLSPVLHRAAYDELGLTGWTYDAVDVTPDRLAGFLDSTGPEWTGLSLTMPLKAAVVPLLDAAAPVVEAVGAANTVVLREGRRVGDNTDVPGLAAALADAGLEPTGEVAVLGAGATARAAVAALAGGRASVTAYARTPARAGALAETGAAVGVQVAVRPWAAAAAAFSAALVVNTAPAEAAAGWLPRLPAEVGALFEVLYDPWPTPLAAAWQARGGTVVSGLDLLVRQAVLQVALFTGATVDERALVARLQTAGEQALRMR